MSFIPKADPREFRDDVVAVAQRREAGVTIKQIADDFGISEGCLRNVLRKAKNESGHLPGTTAAEVRVLRRAAAYLLQANLPGKGSTRS